MDESIRKLIFAAIDETISPEDFERLQDAIEADEQVRSEYLRAINLSESLCEIAANADSLEYRVHTRPALHPRYHQNGSDV